MQSLVVLGPLGSGKTTTLVRLLAEMNNTRGVHLVINEVGRFAVDLDRINQATDGQLDVESLTAGCLGCANLAEFDAIVERLAEEEGVLLVEPTGVADGHEIQAALARHGLPWRCLTLVNPSTLEHDLRAGVLQTQLEVATRVAITRPETVDHARRDELLHLLAPYGVPVSDLSLTELSVDVDELLDDSGAHHHHEHCGHGHDHGHCDHDHHHHGHGHDHDHGHGYVTTPIMLRPDVTAEELSKAFDLLNLRRGKGVVGGVWFDRVGSEFTLGEPRDEAPYAILITDHPLDSDVVNRLTVQQPSDRRSLKQRVSGLSADEAHEEIDRLLAQAAGVRDEAGELRLADESVDLACEIAKAPAVALEYRQKAKQARIRHALAVYDELDWNTASASALCEIGALLAWQTAKRSEEVGQELTAEVHRRKPATMWLVGMMRTGDPRYDLVPAGYSGPLSPAAGSVIVQWGMMYEQLNSARVVSCFEHMLKVSSQYAEWNHRWRDAFDEFNSGV